MTNIITIQLDQFITRSQIIEAEISEVIEVPNPLTATVLSATITEEEELLGAVCDKTLPAEVIQTLRDIRQA